MEFLKFLFYFFLFFLKCILYVEVGYRHPETGPSLRQWGFTPRAKALEPKQVLSYLNSFKKMKQFESELLTRNSKSAEALIAKEEADLDFYISKSTGKLYFACGSIDRGYCSPAVTELYNSGELESLSQLKYAETSKDGQTWVPCLMVVGNSRVAVKSFKFKA